MVAIIIFDNSRNDRGRNHINGIAVVIFFADDGGNPNGNIAVKLTSRNAFKVLNDLSHGRFPLRSLLVVSLVLLLYSFDFWRQYSLEDFMKKEKLSLAQ